MDKTKEASIILLIPWTVQPWCQGVKVVKEGSDCLGGKRTRWPVNER